MMGMAVEDPLMDVPLQDKHNLLAYLSTLVSSSSSSSGKSD